MTPRATLDAKHEAEVADFAFELSAWEAERLGCDAEFWRDVRREIRRNRRTIRLLRVQQWAHTLTRKVMKRWH